MIVFIQNLWAVLMPARASKVIVNSITESDLLNLYSPITTIQWTALLPYKNPNVRACIAEAKFHNNKKAQVLLHTVIAHHLQTTQNCDAVLVPIPLHKRREHARGHNQVVSILNASSQITSPIQLLLKRQVETLPQSELSRDERIKNMSEPDIFLVRDKTRHSNMIICDDVVTTGATLAAAKNTLEAPTGSSVTCLAIAH